MTTTIIIDTAPYPDGHGRDDCYQCDLPAHATCGLCSQPICTDHGRIHPLANQPPLCPPCLEIMHTSLTADTIIARLEKLEGQINRILAALAPVRGLHGQN